MRSSTFFASLAALSAAAAFAQVACSSDDNPPAAAVDAGGIVTPDGGGFVFADAAGPRTIERTIFAPGETRKTIAIPVAADAIYEMNETF